MPTKYKRLTIHCRTCSKVVPFEVPWRWYCSAECKTEARKKDKSNWHKREVAKGRWLTPMKPCLHCGVMMRGIKYCTRTCYDSAKASEIAARKANRKPKPYTCVICKETNEFTYIGRTPKYCTKCVVEVDRKHRKQQRKKRGPLRKPSRRAIERAKKHGAIHENIRPIIILERDKWQCCMCHCSTPKEHRGTTLPTAPEIDHIIPFAKGGDHVISNLQLLCRACNAAKGQDL